MRQAIERPLALWECSRTTFHSACTSDVEMAPRSFFFSLVGKPQGGLQSLGIENVSMAGSVSLR